MMSQIMETGNEDRPQDQADNGSFLSAFISADNQEIVPIRWEPNPGIVNKERLLGEGTLAENYDAADEERPGDYYRVIRLSEEEFQREGPTAFQESFQRRTEDLVEEALTVLRLNPDGQMAGMAQLLEVGVVADEQVFLDGEARQYVFKDSRMYFRYRGIPGGRALSAPDSHALTLFEKAEILIQTARVLAEIHALSSIHGDVKPENILWARDSDGVLRVILVDFGSIHVGARLSSDSSVYAATRDRVFVGGGRIVQPRIDIASFGRTMMEFMLDLSSLPHEEEAPYEREELNRNVDYWLNKAPLEELVAELNRRGYAVAVPFIRYARRMSDADMSRRPQSMHEVEEKLRRLTKRAGAKKLGKTVFLKNFLCGDPDALIRRAEARGHIRGPEVSGKAKGGFARFLRHHMSGDEIRVYEFAGLARGVVVGILCPDAGVCVLDLRMGFKVFRTGELDDMMVEALFDPASPARLRYVVRRRSGWRIYEAIRSAIVKSADYFCQVAFWWRRLWRMRVAGSARVPVKARKI